MDLDDTSEDPLTTFVGKAPTKTAQRLLNPAWRLAGSNHPFAPFTGNSLTWESNVYDDNSTYEGLMEVNIPHNVGVMTFGTFGGGGIPETKQGDRYEGDFESGWAHGMGQYTADSGKIYRGEWAAGRRHGCGMEQNIAPYLKRVKAGEEPAAAWAAAAAEIQERTRYGTWITDSFRAGPDPTGRFCSLGEILGTVQETKHVVGKARMFQHKPDGEVTFRMMQDADGKPLPLMQDPLHYPHGTGFLAPGPMGQCFPLPDSVPLRRGMAAALHNARHTWERYNLDYDFQAGTPLAKGFKLWKQHRARWAARDAHRLAEERQLVRSREANWAAKEREAEGAGGRGAAPRRQRRRRGGKGGGGDALASLPPGAPARPAWQPSGPGRPDDAPPSLLASLSVGFCAAAEGWRDLAARCGVLPRRSLARPSA